MYSPCKQTKKKRTDSRMLPHWKKEDQETQTAKENQPTLQVLCRCKITENSRNFWHKKGASTLDCPYDRLQCELAAR